ncbi:MAG: hypothetical protein LLG97_21160 [Deltaproteobacteria bacterium]|nr:hypothetical protein [Deltaproteobacteria bacterium]
MGIDNNRNLVPVDPESNRMPRFPEIPAGAAATSVEAMLLLNSWLTPIG